MCVNELNLLVATKGREPANAAPINSPAAAQHDHLESLALQLLSQRPQLVEANEQQSETILQTTGKVGGQHFGATDVQAVQHMANGGLFRAVRNHRRLRRATQSMLAIVV